MDVLGSRSIELDLPAVPQSVPRARRAVVGLLDGLGVEVWAVELVVSEAVTNVVLHAYRGRARGRVRLQASVARQVFTLEVVDDGIGMSPRADSPGLGVGLAIIRRLAHEVEVHSAGGTRLLVRLHLAATAGAP